MKSYVLETALSLTALVTCVLIFWYCFYLRSGLFTCCGDSYPDPAPAQYIEASPPPQPANETLFFAGVAAVSTSDAPPPLPPRNTVPEPVVHSTCLN